MTGNWRQVPLTASLSPIAIGALLGPLACGAKFRLRNGHREISFLAINGDRSVCCLMDYAGSYSASSSTLRVISHD